jgi:hypothetical protein
MRDNTRHSYSLLIGALIGALSTGCGSSSGGIEGGAQPADKTEFQSAGEGDAQVDESPTEVDVNDSIEGNLIEAKYQIKVSVGFLPMATGELDLIITKDLGAKDGSMFQIPRGCVNLLDAKVDLKKAMVQFGAGELFASSGSSTPPPKPEIKNNVVSLPGLAHFEFSPPRPFLPSFLAASKEELAKLNVSRNVQFTNKKTGESDSGSFTIQTTAFNTPYTSPAGDYEFKKNIRFTNKASGFDQIADKMANSLFEEMEMVVGLSPIAIPLLSIKSSLPPNTDTSQLTELDIDSLGSADCGPTGGGMLKFVQTLAKSGMLDGLMGGGQGGGSGGQGGGGIGALGGILKDVLMKSLKLKVELHLVDQVGLGEEVD